MLLLLLLLQDAVALDDLHRERDFVWTSDAATGREVVKAGATSIVFIPGMETALLDGVPHKLSLQLREGRVFVPSEIASRIRSSSKARVVEKKPEPKPKAPRPSMTWIESPHYDRAVNRAVRRIVLHTTEGSLSSCISWFRDPRSRVSAHFVVALNGRIVQMVREEDVAWHAGSEHNPDTIGIEHEGYSDRNLWTAEQMKASAELARYLCDRYSIPPDRAHIISHESIAPDRRRDPGRYFDWELYFALITKK